MYKYKIFLLSAIIVMGAVACKKAELQLVNPNAPTPTSALITESGIESYAQGIIVRPIVNVPQEGVTNIQELAWAQQIILGDECYIPYGNFAFRWTNQVYKVTLPDGRSFTTPIGVPQKTSLQGFNSRDAGELNAFQYEWSYCYYFIKQANTILYAVENPALTFSGNAATKKAVLRAWALWWKGYCYSRIGSMYIAGIINNDTTFNFTVNNNFVSRQDIITEATRNFDLSLSVLSGLTNDADYYAVMQTIIPSFSDNSIAHLVTPAQWIRQINSYKARNILVSKKIPDMTAADWTAILGLANQGLTASDNIFKKGLTPDGSNDVSGFTFPYLLANQQNQWFFISERLVQEYKPGDTRLDRNFVQGVVNDANKRSRGLQFGTRWIARNIEDGGSYSTITGQGYVNYACTYEENALMKAEALIYTGQVDQGLQAIDEVRNYQASGLPAVAGTGLTKAQALEELRRERRVALVFRGLSFFDARRWGVTAPASAGGGRVGAIINVPASLAGTPGNTPMACFVEYNYMDYFDVPQNELDFNTPGPGSVPVKQ